MTPPPSEGQPEGNDRPMPLVEHLRELRRRLLVVLGCIGATLVVTWAFSDRVVYFITRPVLPYAKHLQFDTLTDPFFTHFKAALYAAIFFNVPVILFQTWRFVAPGLYKHERKVSVPFLLLSFPLFVGGALFCYTAVFPAAVSYLIQFDPTLVPSLRIGDYVSFTLTLMVIFGLVFEMPLVSLLLTRMGLLTPEFLSRNRRYSVLLIFIFAAVITPTPDAFTQVLLAGPMLVLYEISVLISRMARPRPASGDSSEDKPRAA
jgi:sec-independent protein translocase protein TatC